MWARVKFYTVAHRRIQCSSNLYELKRSTQYFLNIFSQQILPIYTPILNYTFHIPTSSSASHCGKSFTHFFFTNKFLSEKKDFTME